MKNLFMLLFFFLFASFLTLAQDASRDIEANTSGTPTFQEGPKFDYIPNYITDATNSLLYDNGPLVTNPGIGCNNTGDLSVLQNVTLLMSTLGFTANNNPFTLADDFVVPTNDTWTIDSIKVFAYQSNATPLPSLNGVYVRIWNGSPASGGTIIFGDLTTNRLNRAYVTNIYRASENTTAPCARQIQVAVANVSIVLPAGTYWVEYGLTGTSASGPFSAPITILGQTTTGNGLQQTSVGVWGALLDTGSGTPQGIPFEIWGTGGGGGGLGVMLVSDNVAGTDSVEAWLVALGETYTRFTYTAAMGMPTSDWLDYDAVMWIGSVSSGAETDSAVAYCNGGGNILAWDNDQGYFTNATPFFLNYLMSLYQTDAGSDGTITGLEMMSGLTLNISLDPYPDDVLPNTGTFGTGVPIFLAPTTTTYAGMRGNGGLFRSALLCWDPQYGGADLTNRTVVSRMVDWLIDGIVPVELTSFTASVSETNVILTWVTASETNNQGFEIERNSGNGFENVGFVPGFGTTTELRSYSFTDAGLSEGTYTYRLKQVDFNGMYEFSDVVEVEIVVPDVYSLDQNYPNPFNPSTKINFSLAVDSKVSLKIFDVLGQEVATLVNTSLAAGGHNIDFDASSLNSGVYLYRIEATGIDGTNFVDVKKMILTK